MPVVGAGANVFLAAHRAGQRAGAAGRLDGDGRFAWRSKLPRSALSTGCRQFVRRQASADFGRAVGGGRLRRDDDRHLAGARRLARSLRRERRGFRRLRLGGAAAFQELLDLLDFFFGQARQRRPLARDAGLRADIDQFLAVKLQLFR